ncbi:unnamed protein product [Ectocarpus fasciculatus]
MQTPSQGKNRSATQTSQKARHCNENVNNPQNNLYVSHTSCLSKRASRRELIPAKSPIPTIIDNEFVMNSMKYPEQTPCQNKPRRPTLHLLLLPIRTTSLCP